MYVNKLTGAAFSDGQTGPLTFLQVVLERRASEHDPAKGLDLADSDADTGFGIVEKVTFVTHHNVSTYNTTQHQINVYTSHTQTAT